MSEKISIIAELAQGFEGSHVQARLLLKAAAAGGADAAKFQLVYADELATPDYKYYDLFRSLEMKDEEWQDLSDYATQLNIDLYFDIFGTKSLALAESTGAKAIKLHGTDIDNIALLHAVAASSVNKVLLGAGGAYLSEIELALTILTKKEVVILLGFQGYPTATEDNHIGRVTFLSEYLHVNHPKVTVGFADHAEPGTALRYALAATALGAGAKTIEKHLTLGREMKMEDHESALNPDEFLEFTSIIRGCADALGKTENNNDFGMTDSEKGYRQMIRRHAVAARDLVKGGIIDPADVTLKRTSSEQVINDLKNLYQKKLNRDIAANTAISLPDIN
ncbi:MAG: spsE3 [Sediminibacterium sp.]|nr:spsE3 [Sediminibacterium sp.]